MAHGNLPISMQEQTVRECLHQEHCICDLQFMTVYELTHGGHFHLKRFIHESESFLIQGVMLFQIAASIIDGNEKQ